MHRSRVAVFAFLALAASVRTHASPSVLVVCAPGSPGTTAQARPVMEAFASAVSLAAGRPAGSLTAIYHEKAEPGVALLRNDEAILALVPLPFFLEHGPSLGLAPRLQVVRESGATETWSLVAKKGAIPSAAALAGYELAGTPGYAPAFVRGPLLGPWGEVPASATVKFAPAVLSVLRRAAVGEKVAALLDASQSSALGSLPFASDLETVYRTKPLPGTLLCTIGQRAKGPAIEGLIGALARLHEQADGAEVLKAMQIVRFGKADLAGIEGARKAFETAAAR